MHFKILIVFSFCFLPASIQAQVDNIGSGRAIKFNGTGDYIKLGDTYHDVNLPFTVSAWIYLDPTSSVPSAIFVTNDNNPTYRGFWFFVSGTQLWCEFGDGKGPSLATYRRGKIASISDALGRWINVCAVMKSPTDIQLYVNGMNVGGSSSGDSNFTMASSYPGDTPKIGYFFSNNVTYGFKGMMDEVRLWNKALTENDIRTSMCVGLSGNEAGLIGYWNFNETSGNVVYDHSNGAHHGTFIGSPARVYSGAPIGDRSVFQYTSTWTGSLGITDNLDNVVVSNVKGNPEGVHVYQVTSSPSQNGGLLSITPTQPYFGVFIASLDNNNSFDMQYNYSGTAACDIVARQDNSVATWASTGSPSRDIKQRGEFIKSVGDKVSLNLGPDLSICNQALHTMVSDTTNAVFNYLWNTGQTTPGISVSSSGKYWLKITGGCNVAVDTVNIKMLTSPSSFSLGADELPCSFVTKRLQPYSSSVILQDWEFSWQDGSTKSYFDVKQYGQYWVSVKNSCGEVKDSITFQMPGKEIDLNLGSDISSCDNSSIALATNVEDKDYNYLWNTGSTSSGIVVSVSGKYWLKISDGCRIKSDTVNVKISRAPLPIYLGENESICPLVSTRLQFDRDKDDVLFTWQDGSTQSYFDVKEYGEYWVVAKNSCGEVRDSISFTKPELAIGEIPNIITPNGDPYNQYFSFDSEKYGKVSLLVFNRWGKRVYHSDDYKNNWDGGDLVTGIYFYTVKGECLNEVKGSLSIIR